MLAKPDAITLVYLSETLTKKLALVLDLGGSLISHILLAQFVTLVLAFLVA